MSVAGHHLPIWFDEAVGPVNGQAVTWNAATGRFEPADVDISALDTSGLATDVELATKADDSDVVHLTGVETLTGAKTFKGTTPVVVETDEDVRAVQWMARHALGTGDQHRIELFPPMDNGRIALTWWATQAKTDAVRMLSIEAHGVGEGQSQNPNADNHVTIYSVKNDNTVTKMIEWTWGSQWDGILKLLHHARVFGTLEVSGAGGIRLHNNIALNAYDSGTVNRRLLVLSAANNMTVGDVDNAMNMTLTLKAGGTGQVQLQTANTTRLTLTSATATFTLPVILPAATTGVTSLRLPHGSAPSSPVDGDIWTTTAGLFVRINGATVGPLS